MQENANNDQREPNGPEAAAQPKKEIRMVRTSIDMVPEGDASHMENIKVTRTLPEGITGRMLNADILRIGWPSLVELALTQLTSMVDMMMVGRLGDWAISAVGLCNQPKFLLMIAFMSLQVGSTAVIARYRGAGSPEKARNILKQTLATIFGIALVCAVLGYFFAEYAIVLMGGQDEQIIAAGTRYLQIQMIGFPGLALTAVITAALRGVGNSKIAMRYNLVANLTNVVFNYLLIFGNFGFPRLEVAGASIATIISQFVAMALAFVAITRKDQYLRLTVGRERFRFDFGELGKVFKVGMPAMAEQIVLRIGIIICIRTVADIGKTEFATYQICINILSLSFMLGQAFSVSAVSLVGQSLGKKRPDLAQAYTRHVRMLGFWTSAALGVVFFFFGRYIVMLYSDIPQIIAQGAVGMQVIAFMQPIQALQLITSGALRGAGDTRSTAIITGVCVLLVRPPLTILTINYLSLGLIGAWVALFSDQLLRTVLVDARFRSGKWKKIKV